MTIPADISDRRRCEVTGNPVGTGTRRMGAPDCGCQSCRAHNVRAISPHPISSDIEKKAEAMVYRAGIGGDDRPTLIANIVALVTEERERCAQIAHTAKQREWAATDYEDGYHHACAFIASAIRTSGD